MILFWNLLIWLTGLLSSVLWLFVMLSLAAGLLPYFVPSYHPILLAVQSMSRPLLRPIRRLLGGRRLGRIDPAPWLLAALAFLLDFGVIQVLRLRAYWMKPMLYARPGPVMDIVSGLRVLLYTYMFLVMLRAMLSWFRSPSHHPWVRTLGRLTDPGLRLVGRLLPRHWPIDFSPILLLVALSFVDQVLLVSWLEHSARW